ncbi:MAG: hypothetical protein GX287_02790 [Fusobacteria bacterium]|nr:hypothetical protein [Fusobacteriota bacterium]
MLLTVILNYVINSESLSFILNTILIIVLVLVLFYQKILEYKYVRYIIEGTDIENKITSRELFIYGIFINFILITVISFHLLADELDDKYLIIVFALLIFLITKLIKKYVKNKIKNQTKKFSKFEIVLFAIFSFLMILKVVPYELKSFIIPIIYIYLDIKLPKIIWGKIILKIKNSKLKPIKTAIFVMGVLIFLGIIVIVGTIMYIPTHILPILILIEKIKEFKEIKEVETRLIKRVGSSEEIK